MCGRYTLEASKEELIQHFQLHEFPAFTARYNIAPSQQVPIIRGQKNNSHMQARLCRWGLIPHWAKDQKIGYKHINARSETAAEKPSFRAAFKSKRCLVPATGFFEWEKIEKRKQPHYISMKEKRIFAMAGLWDSWKNPEGSVIESFTILTTEANGIVEKIHDRMPVIIGPESYSLWIEQATEIGTIQQLLRPYSAEEMTSYPVSGRVNDPKNDVVECLQRMA